MDKLTHFKNHGVLYENSIVIVFKAEYEDDQIKIVVKSIKSARPSPELLASFRHEYQINHGLNLQGLVHCRQLIDESDAHLLIYDDVGGITLKNYLDRKPLNPDLFFPIALGIVSCISDLHENKIVHKDIKPDNILIHPETLEVKLLDLSLASQLSVENQESVSINKLEGSLPYMAPEQTGRMNRPIDYRSDYYALGITFYEMLTGSLPFISVDPLEYIHFHLAMEPKPASKAYSLVPEMLSKIVAKLMSKSADDRYQSAEGLKADLRHCYQAWKNNRNIPEFIIGEAEILDNLTISPKMYGRENEAEALLKSFERIKKGGLECLMVSGYSGIGKTTLVNELQKPITSGRGHYINGKFDQLQRTTPYTAFTAAFSKLFQHWLTEPEAKLIQRRNVILQALGGFGQVIVEIFPELELILGKQPEIEHIPPEQSQNRFLIFFQKFMTCIASPEEPLVIFIDDLQWIDQGSLRLLELILTTQDVESVLFIGAYRDNEVDDTHPLVKLIDKLKKYGVRIEDVNLGPLDLENTQKLLADSFRADATRVEPLAQILYEKTAGNPFFAREFLKECFNQKMLSFSNEKKLWQWDLEKIASMPGSNNVVDLMLVKIHKLPESSQRSLQFGACLGTLFDSLTLSQIESSSELEIAENLAPALKEGLIQRIAQGLTYKFIHDRIQQAAYQTIPETEKQLLHLKIGRMLLNQINSLENSDQIFEVIDHYKRCYALVDSESERKKLAELALFGGKQAIVSGAYQAAREYLQLGLYWAENFGWDEEYVLLWNLQMSFIEATHLNGQPEQAIKLTYPLLEKSQSNMDKVYVYRLQMIINFVLNRYEENLAIHYKASLLLGFKVLYKPSKFTFLLEFFLSRLRYGAGDKFAQHLLSLKRSNDEKLLLLGDIQSLGGNSAKFAGCAEQSKILLIRYISYSEKWGVPNHMLFQIMESGSRYGFMVDRDLVNYELIYKALDNFLKNSDFILSSKGILHLDLMLMAGYFLKIRDILPQNEYAMQLLIETGSFTYLNFATYADLELSSLSDMNLVEMKLKAEKFGKMGAKLQIKSIVDVSQFVVASLDNLLGINEVSQKQVIDSLSKSSSLYGFSVFNAYFMEDFHAARELVDLCLKEKRWFNQSIPPLIYMTINTLIYAQLYEQANPKDRKKSLQEITTYLKKMKKFSDRNPDNFLHLYLIIQAESARIEGDSIKALDFYHLAISAATDQGFLRWVAIANERASELYLELKDTLAAIAYLQEAIYYYQQWGCALKVNSIKKKYSQLFATKQQGSGLDLMKSSSSTVMMAGELDLLSMIKANQAISSEILLDKLLPRILGVVIESAGAERAVFIGLQRGRWVIEAQAEMTDDELRVKAISAPLSESQDIPVEVVNYAIRSGVHQVIDDMSKEGKYSTHPYVIQYSPKSVLCLPIARDNKIVAVLYLENNLISKAFTTDRLQLLQALSTQIAISLENARYFEYTQELFHSTERFVPKKFLQLLGRENIEEVRIGDSAKVEMSAIFADLRDFTAISESIQPEELTYILNTYLKYMAPIIRNNNGFVNRVLGDGILALFPVETQDAVQASMEMQLALNLFNNEINEAGFNSIFMGIGVNTGAAMLCALGEEERIEANVVSDMVNGASRIEGLNKFYGTQLLISDATYNKLADVSRFSIRKVDVVRVKGKAKPMGIYEVFPISSYEEQYKTNAYIDKFSTSLNTYMAGNFKSAKRGFERCLSEHPEDSVARLFKERCEKFIQTPPPENWDGITTMFDK